MERSEKYNGWLNIDKPVGFTSAQVVFLVKKVLSQSSLQKLKIGHCGTLDPLASGVLPIAIGEATKLSSYVLGAKKKYIFTIQFGSLTETGDKEGRIIQTTSSVPVSNNLLSDITSSFIGKMEQKVPDYSAAKFEGKTFYFLARKGLKVPIRRKMIEIFSLNLLNSNIAEARATYEVECSKGTYIRSLAEDISLGLKTLGFVLELRRTEVLHLTTQTSMSLSLLQSSFSQALSSIKKHLLGVEELITHIPHFNISLQKAQKVLQGRMLDFQEIGLSNLNYELICLKYSGHLVSIGQVQEGRYCIFCNFNLIDINVDNN